MKKAATLGILAATLLGAAFIGGCQMTGTVPEYDGSALFQGYCAGCHGPSGAGDGPVAASLAVGMEDLRGLSSRNGGVFPRDRLKDIIDGRTLRAAHGTPDMPVWGWEFRMVEESEAHVQARIDALLNYLESIQRDG